MPTGSHPMAFLRPAALLLVGVALSVASAAPAARRGDFEVETVAPGVRVYRNVALPAPGANSLVVERSDGLLVIDAQPTPEAARALLAAIATDTKKPVRYLVLTHAHVEAGGGASAFPEATLVIASDNARSCLEDASYDAGAEWRARAADPSAWRSPRRVLPVLHASGPLTLDDPVRKVVISPLPRAHSRGDLWVELPGTGVIAVGGLLVGDRNPYGGDADVHGWIGALNDLVRDDLTAIVPCAGRTLSVADVKQMRDGLAWVRGRVQAAFTDLVPADQVAAHVLSDPGMAKWFDRAAVPSFARTVVDEALAETLADRKRRGLP
jgi:glyoxylase-like metal-dependent hydrolase (beta-lactamase superfamily II)